VAPEAREDLTPARGEGWFGQVEERNDGLLEALGLLDGFGLRPLDAIRAAHARAWDALPPLDAPALTRALLAALASSRGELTRLLRIVRAAEAQG
jgi:hypothetical protein